MALHYLLSSWGLCKGVYYTALTDRGPCPLRRGWCLYLLLWPTLKKSSSSQALDENELLDAWTLAVGRSDCRCHTPGSSSKPPSSSEKLSLGALLRYFRCPIPVQISGLGTGTGLSWLVLSWQTADWETNIQSGLSRCWNKRSWNEKPNYFSCFVARFFTDQPVVYFYT